MASDLTDHSGVSTGHPLDIPVPSSGEMLATTLWTVAADLFLFHSEGYSGPGVFFAIVPFLFLFARRGWLSGRVGKIALIAILAVSFRLFWLGSGLTLASSVALLIAISMVAAGSTPLVLEGLLLAMRSVSHGIRRLAQYRFTTRVYRTARTRNQTVSWLLPLAAALVFGSIFVFANPDMVNWVSTELSRFSNWVVSWMTGISIWEAPFCVAALVIGAGLMRPSLPMIILGGGNSEADRSDHPIHSPWYPAFRNTLTTLIVLFSTYLVFEFTTLFKREFPPGFYYAGYAHQGAAWLTLALALATGLLSLIFRRSMLHDPRLTTVRRLTWCWSGLNLLLAVAVYNRLMIYVGYNGMTRMRTIGFFGITIVVIGFGLVLYKIAKDRTFWWVLRAQLIALAMTVIAYSVFPVDYLAHRYNAWCISQGHLHPAVMIAVKPVNAEGVFPLLNLTEVEDPIIREGVLALLAKHQSELKTPRKHWTEFQACESLLARRLASDQAKWADYQDPVVRDATIKRFRDYAMQWY